MQRVTHFFHKIFYCLPDSTQFSSRCEIYCINLIYFIRTLFRKIKICLILTSVEIPHSNVSYNIIVQDDCNKSKVPRLIYFATIGCS